MRLAIAFTLLLLTVTGCKESSDQQANDSATKTPATQKPADDTPLSPEAALLADALEQVTSGEALLVDVRSQEEWDESHFSVAKHIPIDKIQEDAETAFGEIKKEQTVFLHWGSGGRAGRAAKMLEAKGYTVVCLGLKYEAIKEAGFEEAAK